MTSPYGIRRRAWGTQRMRFRPTIAALPILVAGALSACAPREATYHDPVQYCAAVGTIERPDERYGGPATPEWMDDALGRALRLGPIGDRMVAPVAWRCAGGSVIACSRGLGMACDERADASRVPSRATLDFCRAFPDVERPLPSLDGVLSRYRWICRAGWPHIIGLQPGLDAEGYPARYWFRIAPGGSFSAKIERRHRAPPLRSGIARPAWSSTSTSAPPT